MFGGGKVIRESMGQSLATRAEGAPDLVITGAVILDHWGIVKADIGIRDGRIVGIGKAGNPDTMDGVHPALVIGPSTEIMAGQRQDRHRRGDRLPRPPDLPAACSTRRSAPASPPSSAAAPDPAEGSKATTVTPGAWHLARMLEALDHWPINVALLGKGNTVSHDSLWEQLRGGAAGFKLHEDWGTTPAAIDACLTVADESGVQVAIHTDTLNEAGFVDVDARRDRRPDDPRLPHRGRRRRARPGHHHRRLAAATCCRRRPTRPGRTPSTPSTSTSTC